MERIRNSRSYFKENISATFDTELENFLLHLRRLFLKHLDFKPCLSLSLKRSLATQKTMRWGCSLDCTLVGIYATVVSLVLLCN